MSRIRNNDYFPPDEKPPLIAESPRRVQFDEVDSLRIVWHGHYIAYFEQGRNEWGRKFGFTYYDMLEHKFVAPIVQAHSNYFKPLHYDEQIIIRTFCHWTEASKMNMSYEILAEDGEIATRGYTTQMFTTLEGAPLLIRPDFVEDFYQNWDKWGKQV